MADGTARPRREQTEAGFHHNNFDFIRLFAAIQVVIFHCIYHLGIATPAWAVPFGPFQGVPIFFVVSGFLITASYERSSSVRSYAEKRARRILPGLWFCILATALCVLALGYPLLSWQGGIWFVSQLAALIYTPSFLSSFGFGSYNGSLWTIPVELQFYATVPILAWAMRRTEHRTALLVTALTVSAVLAIVFRTLLPSIIGAFEGPEPLAAKLVRYSFAPHYFLFVLGATTYYLALHVSPFVRGKALVWLALFLAIKLTLPVSAFSVVAGQLALGVLTISVAFTAVAPNLLRGRDISYGVYLFHGLLLNLLIVGGLAGNELALYVAIAGSIVVGAFSWFAVESRFLKRAA